MTQALRFLLVLCLLVPLAAPLAASSTATETATETDARAVEVALQTLQAMGGTEAWAGTRYLRFEFFGFRLHHWDRDTGRYRLEGKTRDGEAYVVLMNLNDREKGRAWKDGKSLAGEELDTWLANAWSAWVNDTYWLLMPYKLLDPGVHLSYDGEEALDGVHHHKLKLTFEGVGLTPGDTYWAWINQTTGLMTQWAYFLQDWEKGREPTVWRWLDWQRYGDIMLSPRRQGAERQAELGQIAVFKDLPDAVFESPDAVSGTE